MAFGICLVFELAADIHITKDVIQVPIELSKLLDNCPVYLITRPNSCQKKISEYVNIIYLGESIALNDNSFETETLENSIFSPTWYQEACKLAAKYADILMLFPHFGNPTKGAIVFRLQNLLRRNLSSVYLKLDADPRGFEQSIHAEHTYTSSLKKFKNKIKATVQYFNNWLKYLPITAISAESSFTLEMFTRSYSFVKNKIFLVKNCLPQKELVNLPDRDRLINNKKSVFLAIGRLSEFGKATEILLTAWIAFTSQYSSWKLQLVGSCDPDFQEMWIKKLQEANSEHTVEWLGAVYDRKRIWEIYGQSSILVIPSRHESGPMTFVEAIVSGCAVISTPVGEVPYVLGNNNQGIFPIDDVESLTRVMIKFATDDSVRRKQLESLAGEVKSRQWHIQMKPVAEKIKSKATLF